jgi:hypothetical protein
MKHNAITSLFLGALVSTCGFAQATGRIQGVVNDEQGRALSEATVSVLYQPPPLAVGQRTPPPPGPTFNAVVQTAANGTYSIASVPAGDYRLCVQVDDRPGRDFVGTCTWDLAGVAVKLTSGATTAVPTITMRFGHRVKIKIDDPSSLLDKNEGKGPGGSLLVGVFAPHGFYIPARLVAKTPKDRDYEIVIPFDTPVRASVASPGFQVSNLDTNATVDTLRGTGEPLTVGRGAAQRTLRYRINGFTPTLGAPIN